MRNSDGMLAAVCAGSASFEIQEALHLTDQTNSFIFKLLVHFLENAFLSRRFGGPQIHPEARRVILKGKTCGQRRYHKETV